MADRICINCGGEMQHIKNGFNFVMPDHKVYTSDLWGCRSCRRFQIHGIPNKEWTTLHGIVTSGVIEKDQGEMSESFVMVTDPVMSLSIPFFEHMEKWYPDWEMRWRGFRP